VDDFQDSHGNLMMIIWLSLDKANGRGQHGSGAGQCHAPVGGEWHAHHVSRNNRVSSQSISTSRDGSINRGSSAVSPSAARI
jgi:hypothetical protein